jgi:hypothetical protein
MGDRLLVVWDGLALGDLSAKVQAAQDLPDVRGVRAHAKLHLYYRRDASQCPQLVGKTVGSGTLQQQVEELVALHVGQLARPAGHRLRGQGGIAALPPGIPPLRGGAVVLTCWVRQRVS